MKPKLSRFLALSQTERKLFCRSTVLLPLAACAVRTVGLRKSQLWIERCCGRPEPNYDLETTASSTDADVFVRMVAAASHHGFFPGNCLSQSLLLWYLLRRDGRDARLCIGGRKNGISFEAHAWVEVDGHAMNESANVRDRFTLFSGSLSGEVIANK